MAPKYGSLKALLMMTLLPGYLPLAFFGITMITYLLFLRAIRRPQRCTSTVGLVALCLTAWLLLQGFLGYNGFYLREDTVPPRFPLAVAPALLTIVLLFASRGGRRWVDGLSLERLTWLNTVRIAVELVLYGLYRHGAVPEVMTFAGRNFDILVGLTAPLVAYFGIRRKRMGRGALLAWNLISLGILLNVVIHAILALPTPFQQIAFDRPNVAVLYFPFIWLPAFVVPVALLTHLVAIRRLVQAGPVAARPAPGI